MEQTIDADWVVAIFYLLAIWYIFKDNRPED